MHATRHSAQISRIFLNGKIPESQNASLQNMKLVKISSSLKIPNIIDLSDFWTLEISTMLRMLNISP